MRPCNPTRACRIRSIPALIVSALLLPGTFSAAEEIGAERDDVFLHSEDYAELVEANWPRIALGDVDAMYISFTALNNCWHFKDAVRASESLEEFDKEMEGEHPGMIRFGRRIFSRCKRLVERYDWYPGWEQLRLRAALAGDRQSRLDVVRDFYRFRFERPREDFPYSPAQFVLEALDDRDPMLFGVIAITDAPWGLREQNGPIVKTAWFLVYCRYKGNCDSRESMKITCAAQNPACNRYENAFEAIRADAGSEDDFAAAENMADELISAIEEKRYDDLGLVIVY